MSPKSIVVPMESESEVKALWPSGVEFTDDLTPAGWIGPRLMGWGRVIGTPVGAVVPTGYPAYVRLLHPVSEGSERVRWRDLVEAAHLVYHPLIQWERLPSPLPPGIGHQYSNPEVGHMSESLRRALVPHLAREGSTPDSVYFGIWDGWGYLHHKSSGDLTSVDDPLSRRPRRRVSLRGRHRKVEGRPTFSLPHRAYLLAHGALADLTRLPLYLTPSLIWPEDLAFCCATEIDFDSTLVGLSKEGARQILDDEDLEALPISVEDRLDIGGDTLNPYPDPASSRRQE